MFWNLECILFIKVVDKFDAVVMDWMQSLWSDDHPCTCCWKLVHLFGLCRDVPILIYLVQMSVHEVLSEKQSHLNFVSSSAVDLSDSVKE